MLKSISISPVMRAVLVIGAVAALVTGVTFAALSDTATLADNHMTTNSADLQVSNGGAYGDDVAGFNANNVVPGTGQTFPFFLKNGSGFDMNITVSVAGPCSTYVNGSQGISDCSDVLVTFKDTQSATESTYTLQQLIDAPQIVPGDQLPANTAGTAPASGDEGDYEITFDLDPADVTGTSATLTEAFDLVFTGTQPVPTP